MCFCFSQYCFFNLYFHPKDILTKVFVYWANLRHCGIVVSYFVMTGDSEFDFNLVFFKSSLVICCFICNLIVCLTNS